MNLPRVMIDLGKLAQNARVLKQRCQRAGVEMTAVVKGLAGDFRAIKAIIASGITEIGDSRLENLEPLQELKNLRKVMLRLPSRSQITAVASKVDCSLNTEMDNIKLLNAAGATRVHEIVLMVDLGDRREGVMPDNLLEVARFCKGLPRIKLVGLGTNFACFGGAIPTVAKLEQLSSLAEILRTELRLPLEIVSGGNSSSLPLVYDGAIPKGINHLRVGEAILLGRETLSGKDLPDLNQDVFKIEAEVIQAQVKPHQAEGPLGRDAFGRVPQIPELEPGPRMLLNLGAQDTVLSGLTPVDKELRVLGGSSDYLVLAGPRSLAVGSLVEFWPNYWSLLAAMTSPYVAKEYTDKFIVS